MENNPIKQIKKFAFDRQIEQIEYNHFNYATNIIEELIEGLGGSINKNQREELKGMVISFFEQCNKFGANMTKDINQHEKIDFINDIIVFSLTEIMKLGYDPEKTLLEVAKEINSRKGTIVNNKFQKDTSPEAKALWYKADFKECEL